jgi:hypothetical protein
MLPEDIVQKASCAQDTHAMMQENRKSKKVVRMPLTFATLSEPIPVPPPGVRAAAKQAAGDKPMPRGRLQQHSPLPILTSRNTLGV